ncbi:MAG: c-type cytochrome [Rhodospirillaceae bacterium]|nr:c-type cytochrome [Rhodospirillaceae bacterium]
MKNLLLTTVMGAFALAMASAPTIASADEDAEKLFKKRCAACHSAEAGKHLSGPSLAGIMGRKAGSTDFTKYTGLKGSSVVWDENNLDEFLADPKKFVGEKTMAYKLKKEDERKAIIEYLKSL